MIMNNMYSFKTKETKVNGKTYWIYGIVDLTRWKSYLISITELDSDGNVKDLFCDTKSRTEIPMWDPIDPLNKKDWYNRAYLKEVAYIVGIDL